MGRGETQCSTLRQNSERKKAHGLKNEAGRTQVNDFQASFGKSRRKRRRRMDVEDDTKKTTVTLAPDAEKIYSARLAARGCPKLTIILKIPKISLRKQNVLSSFDGGAHLRPKIAKFTCEKKR